MGAFFSLPFVPLLVSLGRKVRKTVPRLPEAGGPTEGLVGEGEASIRILTMGESTIAGVGVDNHQEGMTGQLAESLHDQIAETIRWQVLAKSGYRVEQVTRHLVPKIPVEPIDLIVIGLGGNDAFAIRGPLRWKNDLNRLINHIRLHQPTAEIVFANMPPIYHFPAFPRLLQLTIGNLVRLLGRTTHYAIEYEPNVHYINQPIRLHEWVKRVPGTTVEDFFSDGVHPSPLTYKLWGQEIAKFIVENQLIERENDDVN